MKLLRNPVFTAGLVLIAIALVLYQSVGPRLRLGGAFGSRAFPSTSAAIPSASPSSPSRTGIRQSVAGLGPTIGIDREYAELHFEGWVEWPQRDPFLLLTPDPEEINASTETNSPVPTWKLKAILEQTGSRLAVINRGTYSEGDQIEGYRVDRIDKGGVWFVGPKERERLGFDTRPRPPATNAPTPAVVTPPPPPTLVDP